MNEGTVIDRRGAIVGAGAVAAGAMLGGAAAATPGLHAIAATKGRAFGTCLSWSPKGADAGSLANPRYAALATRDCGIAVPENALKWQALRPSPAAYDFARFDAILRDAERAGMRMRGHTLLWHYDRWFPKWLVDHDFGKAPAREAARILTQHIRTVCARYAGRIYSYDVVNEAVDPADGSLRSTALSRAMGGAEAVLDLAFRTAREAAPKAELVYNDYMSWEAGNEKHRDGVLRLLAGFRTRGVPVDALGVQSHIGVFAPTDSIERLVATLSPDWRAFLDRVVGMGYRLVVTEFDVRDRGLPADIAVRDAGVAAFAKGYLDLMLSYPQLRDVLCWGMTDRYSWLRGFEPRPDGLPTRGAPYDASFRAKPIHAAMHAALAR
ncbi:glycosyl hydrolase [Sphingomonas sp. Leaf412]|uniref:endo-1,4-beta-xylanase n=1 Tax=Sphingomonas sp. Leaf412 TaxID=1736370 RepID=UPI0006FCF222|nr:endo-1,4-beta-xylanase [Sphingomonas sp. Leaf412]KQT32713.1 glycosyl hydrolase [Sphingomonas sp. Leaf412]